MAFHAAAEAGTSPQSGDASRILRNSDDDSLVEMASSLGPSLDPSIMSSSSVALLLIRWCEGRLDFMVISSSSGLIREVCLGDGVLSSRRWGVGGVADGALYVGYPVCRR